MSMNNQDLTINSLHSTFNDCWNQIGVTGDRSCEELNSYMHCHNCPVYSAAGRGLLEREVPPEYLKQWTEILSETSTQQVGEKTKLALVGTSEVISLIIFRIGVELFSIPVRLLQEVTPTCVIHTLPHHTNELFLGLVNIRGETLLRGCPKTAVVAPKPASPLPPRAGVPGAGGRHWGTAPTTGSLHECGTPQKEGFGLFDIFLRVSEATDTSECPFVT